MDRVHSRLLLLMSSKSVVTIGSWVFTWLILQICGIVSATTVAWLLLSKLDLTIASVFEPYLLLWLSNEHISLKVGIFAVFRVLAMRFPSYTVLVSELGRLNGSICALILVSSEVKDITLIGAAHWTVTWLLMLLMLLLLLLLISSALEHKV